MADPLSVIAGIAGIAVAGVQLSNALYQISDKLMHAPRAIRDVASNMSLLSSILENLADVLKQGQGVYKRRVITETESILERFKRVQKEVSKIVKRQGGMRARMGWVFNSSKVGELLDQIEALKSAMNLVLWTVHLAIVQKDASTTAGKGVPEKGKRFRSLVESIIRENRQSIITLHYEQRERPIVDANGKTTDIDIEIMPEASQTGNRGFQTPKLLDDRNSESQPSNMHNNQITTRNEVIHNDTATWLYRLVFASETPSANETSSDRGGYSHDSDMSIQKLQRLQLPMAISTLLQEWTLLSQEDISSIAYESASAGTEEPYRTGFADSASDISDTFSPRRAETINDYWDSDDEYARNEGGDHRYSSGDHYVPANEYERWQLWLAQERQKEAEEKLQQEKREDLLKKRLELKYLKDMREREEEEYRIKQEEERLKKEWDLKKEKEAMEQQHRAIAAAEERKRILEEHRLREAKEKEEAEIARQKIIEEHEINKQREEESSAKRREAIIAELEEIKAETIKAKAMEDAQYDIARELIHNIFGKFSHQDPRTYQSISGDDIYSDISTLTGAQHAHEKLRQIQDSRRSRQDPPEGSEVPVSGSDALCTTSIHKGIDEDKDAIDCRVLFSKRYNSRSPHMNALATSLTERQINPMFEISPQPGFDSRPLSLPIPTSRERFEGKNLTGSLLWEPSAIPGGSELYRALSENGWKPVYMRGSEAGQTWYHGPQPIHARFLRPDYIPQLGWDSSASPDEYLVIGSEWIEQDALHLAGIDYRMMPSGLCVLEADIQYDDILSLFVTSFLLRESALRRSAKKRAKNSSSISTPSESTVTQGSGSLPALEFITGVPRLELQSEPRKSNTQNNE